MKGGHKKPWTISLHNHTILNHTILIHHKQNYFIQHTMSGARCKRGRAQLSSLRGLGSLVFEGALYLSARSNQGNTVCYIVFKGRDCILSSVILLTGPI